MTLDELKLILDRCDIPYPAVATNPGQLQISCPLAQWTHEKGTDNAPSFGIWYDATPANYHCFSCKESGDLHNLVYLIGQHKQDQDLIKYSFELAESDKPSLETVIASIGRNFLEGFQPQEEARTVPLNESVLDRFPKAWDSLPAKLYLEDRGFDKSTIEFWDLRYSFDDRRIIFPARNADGNLVGMVGRTVEPGVNPKYKNYFGFNATSNLGGMHLVKESKRLHLVEGFFDLINTHRFASVYENSVVCTWTSRVSPEQSAFILSQDCPIDVFYDLDKAGDTGWSVAQKLLQHNSFGLYRAHWDFTDSLGNLLDPGEFNSVQYNQVLSNLLETF